MEQDKYPRDMATGHKLLVNYNPMGNSIAVTSYGITFETDGRPCKQEDTNKYNATKKVNETINSSSYTNYEKSITNTPVEETGTQKIMARIKMDNFDNSPYSLMFLNNAIQKEETNADHRSGTIFPSSTIHDNILVQAKVAIN